MAGFTAFDIIVLLLVGVLAARGLARGFVTEILSLMAWVAAIMALRLFYDPAAIVMRDWTGSESSAAILAFAAVFLVSFFAFRAVATMLGNRTKQSVVGPVDRVLGLGFGAVKGLIGASLLFLFAGLTFNLLWGPEEPRPAWMRASKTAPLLSVTSRAVIDFVEEQTEAELPGNEDGAVGAPDDAGYTREDREQLDDLLKQTGATPI